MDNTPDFVLTSELKLIFKRWAIPTGSLWAPVVQVTFQVYSDRVCPDIS